MQTLYHHIYYMKHLINYDKSPVYLTELNNWLNSSYVYTITKDYGSSRNVFDTGGNGYVRSIIPNGGVSEQNGHPIKPTFYLNSAVEYLSGNGSSSSPYRIDLEN